MRKLLLLTLLLFVVSPLAARRRSAAEIINTGNAQLDSLIVQLNHRTEWVHNEGIGAIDIYVNIRGRSHCENVRWWTPLLRDLLPFYHHANDTTYFDAICKIAYQTPCETLITPIRLTGANRRRCRRIIRELNQIVFPIYALKIMRDKGDNKDYILPFTNDGLRQYNFTVTDTTLLHNDSLVTIHFTPRKQHHELLEGDVLINLNKLSPHEVRFKGRIDFGWVTDTLRFTERDGYAMLHSSSVDLDYKYGKMLGHNHFDYELDIRKILPTKAFDPQLEPLDLSDVYHTDPTVFVHRDTISQALADTTKTSNESSRREFFERLPQRMVSTTRFNAFDTDIRVTGLLNPAGFGFDHINGITIRQPLSFSRRMNNGQELSIRPEIGYAFRLQEFRYKWDTEWLYCPERRATLTLRLQNGTNGFSSRYRNKVNELINQYVKQLENDGHLARETGLSFDSLGLQFFRRYEFTLENAIELTHGLMFHAGATYSIRRPVRHGAHAMPQTVDLVTNETIEQRYLDLSPYMRLVWTPRQYYYMEERLKRYLQSQWPTFALEVGKGVKNVLKSRTDYLRIELDAQQFIRIGSSRNLSWHVGAGRFFKQRNEYFVNYTYFSRSQYPSTWNNRASGGAFALLDDYWYSSSSGYIQQHVMLECPFLLLHNWRLISKYIIKERVYNSQLWARGKNYYCEWGYGIGNNYFNASLFCGFIGLHPFDVGAKFSIEIDRHL